MDKAGIGSGHEGVLHMAAELTKEQLRTALAIAASSGFNTPSEPAFVAGVLQALVSNYRVVAEARSSPQ